MAAGLPLRVTTTASSRSSTPVTNSGNLALTSEIGKVLDIIEHSFAPARPGICQDRFLYPWHPPPWNLISPSHPKPAKTGFCPMGQIPVSHGVDHNSGQVNFKVLVRTCQDCLERI